MSNKITKSEALVKFNCILLNDTSYESHFGCETVIKNLKKFLAEMGINILKSIPCGKTMHYYQLAEKLLNQVDIIIVNGEGTLHDDQEWAKDLILFCEKIKIEKNIPIILFNALILNNSNKFMERLNIFDLINVRDSESKANIEENNLKCILTPDFSFYSELDKFNLVSNNNNNILVNDSVNDITSKNLFNYSIKNKYTFIPIRTFNKIEGISFISFMTIFKTLVKITLSKFAFLLGNKSSFNYINYFVSKRDILRSIISSKGVITGRFIQSVFVLY